VGDRAADFEHVVLTRFSAVFTHDQPAPDPAWLRYRLGFFVEACVASMRRQEGHPPVRWLVFFDDRCDKEFRAEVDELSRGVFEPIWTHDVFWSGLVPQVVAQRSSAPWLITTRLDSDDAVAKDFVSAIHGQFEQQELMFLNFPRGLQVARSGEIFLRDYPSGPFLSLVERRDPEKLPLTVFGSRGHSSARRLAPIREVMTHPMWMQVVHGSNVANEIRGVRVSPRIAEEHFDIDLPYETSVPARVLARQSMKRIAGGARRWIAHPRSSKLWFTAMLDRLRGTHTKAMKP
jgi:hypothetical protein